MFRSLSFDFGKSRVHSRYPQNRIFQLYRYTLTRLSETLWCRYMRPGYNGKYTIGESCMIDMERSKSGYELWT